MAYNLAIGAINHPQHARVQFTAPYARGLVDGAFQLNTVMDIYTGTCVFDFQHDTSTRDKLISLVPLGLHGPGPNLDIQDYPGPVTAIISASMTSFGDEPDAAAVDGALVQLETHTFPGFRANVLVIHAEIGVDGGHLWRMAYQVTVLAQGNAADGQFGTLQNVAPDQGVPDN